jgi:peptidoglycan hydrolase-like amidase
MALSGMRQYAIAVLLLLTGVRQAPTEPIIRVGVVLNAASVTIRSSSEFTVEQRRTRSATFTTALALDPAARGVLKPSDLQYRLTVTIGADTVLVLPLDARVRIEPPGALLEIDDRAYRGALEVFGNARHSLTVVNELPLEDYLRGVVPNELSPAAFGQIEALKAQAVAARTYVERNLGQYRAEGYDVCATDACQVYLGAKTEDPLATQAIAATRGIVATYEGKPINALYSSTCGGRTEDAGNIFQEKIPYLVSVDCEYKHPRPLPFSSARSVESWKDGVLATAHVSTFADAARFMGLPDRGEPASLEPAPLAAFVRQTFYPAVSPPSDLSFLIEQGVMPATGAPSRDDLLFRLIERKSAFEWQQGVLTSWDGQQMRLIVNGQAKTYSLAGDALIYQRVGDDRLPMRQGTWIGGELIEFRAEESVIPMLVFRINFANPAADRYSRLAVWQTHKTRAELDAAIKSLAIGEFVDMRVVERGPSERPIATEIVGSTARKTVPALRLRTLFGLRDSLFYFDIERNARGAVLGTTFYGRGWGHGVGMCQVGAYGMALDGATYDEILKKYYRGIELTRLY